MLCGALVVLLQPIVEFNNRMTEYLLKYDLLVMFFLQAVHSFEAESEKELSLSKGDFVVVRKVAYIL